MSLVLIFTTGLSGPQGHGTVGRDVLLKIPVTPQGIDPGTVRLVAQRLNHYATPGSTLFNVIIINPVCIVNPFMTKIYPKVCFKDSVLKAKYSGFGSLGGYRAGLWYPSSWVQTRPKPSDFSRRKNPQRAFLRKGSKTVGPMSLIYGM
jgi:hypothetical protein